MTQRQHTSSIDPAEVAKFQAMAAEWWDPQGKFKPLHMLNPTRLDYVTAQVAAQFGRDRDADQPFVGLSVLDIGCGGGLMAEPMARLGATVTGADAAPGNIAVASLHAQGQGLPIDYRATTSEALAAEGLRYDVVMALEIVEHVADPAAFVATCRDLLRPGGMLIQSTLNRTAKSFGAAIIGAEWIMRWLPKGTHDWRRFITPDELAAMTEAAGLRVVDRCGMVFNPLGWSWSLSPRDLSVNYAMTALRED
ncbi:bifunctional 2-polyprenyl-6-hydroxyphenol methylase/3-demethylubiquinol 3-O-methyltransferase UbiG [Paracoccus yeei]|uniref:bifunctional 2-polyprenyl-6-hydroxyphenol methylase/3-demethylubiquinol 3-O-methyltransferase UbiG n=1 Tax=Paracoccus yeei TaxID=147645 RepID=UPI00048DBA9E|nr:bifunctional 2-polyprenyl-6-hydroxyphenol methylase/3-demethylubiquinol 3-O-methyltransferase UbiG [Paracoccus yeei]OWJ94752.1 bifunctional 3-demethylubiquinone 3-O-methyltransferase/2-octaprenyl-6-hydroxy phenol methylase [Paracoccus yeei]